MEARLTHISTQEVLGYLGCRGSGVTEQLIRDIAEALSLLTETAVPKSTYRVFERCDNGCISDLDFSFESKDIDKLLSDCNRVILFAATLGAQVDMLLRRYQVSDLQKALVLDACANAAIENVCDNLCTDFALSYGLITHRFSPGYGDLAFEKQSDFARVLDLQRSIGVTLTDSGLMIPQKSVTAVVGILRKESNSRE